MGDVEGSDEVKILLFVLHLKTISSLIFFSSQVIGSFEEAHNSTAKPVDKEDDTVEENQYIF